MLHIDSPACVESDVDGRRTVKAWRVERKSETESYNNLPIISTVGVQLRDMSSSSERVRYPWCFYHDIKHKV